MHDICVRLTEILTEARINAPLPREQGVRLVKIVVIDEITLVEQLILWIPFGSIKSPLPSPVRFHPYSDVFISQVHVCIMLFSH